MRIFTYFRKNFAKTPLLCQNQIIIILWKQIGKHIVKKKKKNYEILTIFNRYKETLDGFINILDVKSQDQLGPIHKNLSNTSRFENNSKSFLKNKDILNWLS